MDKGYYDYAKYGSIGISWVLSTSIYLYLGYKGGNYLDAKLDSAPIFLLIGLIGAIGLSLKSLVSEILVLTRETGGAKRSGERPEDDAGEREKCSGAALRESKWRKQTGPKDQ